MSEVLMGFEKTSRVPVKGAKILTTPDNEFDDMINGAHEDVFPIIVIKAEERGEKEKERGRKVYRNGLAFIIMCIYICTSCSSFRIKWCLSINYYF